MKLVRLGPDEVFHRYLTPKWAFVPTSGAGAAMVGGRFNRIGVEALYLSRAPQTALEEYRQGSALTRSNVSNGGNNGSFQACATFSD